jgi:hypothetical protein
LSESKCGEHAAEIFRNKRTEFSLVLNFRVNDLRLCVALNSDNYRASQPL